MDFTVTGTACSGSTTHFSARVVGGQPNYSYLWNLGDSPITYRAAEVDHVYATSSHYTVPADRAPIANFVIRSRTREITIAGDPPNPVADLVVAPAGIDLDLAWSANDTSAGRPVDHYLVYRASTTTGQFALRRATTQTSALDPAAWLDGEPGFYRVAAENGCGSRPDQPGLLAHDGWTAGPRTLVPVRLPADQALEILLSADQARSTGQPSFLGRFRLLAADAATELARSEELPACGPGGLCGARCSRLALAPGPGGLAWLEVIDDCPAGEREPFHLTLESLPELP